MILGEDAPTQVSQAITFAIVGGVFAFLTLWFTTRAKRKDAAINDAREVAREERLAEREEAHASRLASLEEHTTRIEKSQDVMHAMLNSSQTSQMLSYIVTMKASRASLRTQQAQMRELAEMRGNSHEPTMVADLTALQEQIEALGTEIASTQDAVDDRVRAQELAEARERNRTRDNMANEVSAMVPAGVADPTKAPAVADKPRLPPTTGDVPINIENASITVAAEVEIKKAGDPPT